MLKFTKSQALALFYTQSQVDALIAGVSSGLGTGDIFIGGDATVTGDIFALSDIYATGDVWVGGGITNLQYAQFDLLYSDGQAEGRVQWNAEDGTLEFGLPGGNVNLQVGQEHVLRVRNTTGSTIINGKAVYITGASGNKPLVALADNTSPAGSHVVGVATEDLGHNSDGYVTLIGLVRDINTDNINVGGTVFLGITGDFIAAPPTAPAFKARVGWCIVKHASSGVLLVHPDTVPRLQSMSDVYGSPGHGQVPSYDTGDTRFEFVSLPSEFNGTYAGDVMFGGALDVGTGDVTEFGHVLDVYYSGDLVAYFSYDGNLYLDGGVQAEGTSNMGNIIIPGSSGYVHLDIGSNDGFPVAGGYLRLYQAPSSQPAYIQMEDEAGTNYYLNWAADGNLHGGTSISTGDPDTNLMFQLGRAPRQAGWYMDGADVTGDILAYHPLLYGEGPYDLTSALVDYRTAGTGEATWVIEYCDSGDFVSTPSWASVFATPITVDAGELSSQSAAVAHAFIGSQLSEGARLRTRCTVPGGGDSATISLVFTGTT